MLLAASGVFDGVAAAGLPRIRIGFVDIPVCLLTRIAVIGLFFGCLYDAAIRVTLYFSLIVLDGQSVSRP
jgi:hypothetical protein